MDDDQVEVMTGTFRGDFAGLAAMMQQSWAGNNQLPMLYSPEFLAKLFEYPGASLELAPAVYAGDRLIAFAAGFPRVVDIKGQRVQLLLNSLLTASAECKGSGYGLSTYAELLRRARQAGYDGTIGYCVEGDDMNGMMPALSRLHGFDTRCIYNIEYLSRFLRPVASGPEIEASDDEIELYLDLTAALPNDLSLRRCWTREEAIWQCRRRSGAVVASLAEGRRRGMLTGYIMSAAGSPPSRVVLFEDLLWGDLDAAERTKLLQRFLQLAAARGAQTASCPVLGYAPLEPLTAAGFRSSKRILHAYLTIWNGRMPDQANALYIDVF